MEGFVKNIPEGKDFGFIRVPNSKDEYFFHRSDFLGDWDDLVDTFNENKNKTRVMNVTFEAVKSAKGPRAANVVLI